MSRPGTFLEVSSMQARGGVRVRGWLGAGRLTAWPAGSGCAPVIHAWRRAGQSVMRCSGAQSGDRPSRWRGHDMTPGRLSVRIAPLSRARRLAVAWRRVFWPPPASLSRSPDRGAPGTGSLRRVARSWLRVRSWRATAPVGGEPEAVPRLRPKPLTESTRRPLGGVEGRI